MKIIQGIFLCVLVFLGSCRKELNEQDTLSPIYFFTEFGSFDVERVRHFDDGRTILVGQTNEQAMIVALNKAGKVEWSHKLSGDRSSIYKDIAKLDNGNYVAIGSTDSRDLGASGTDDNALIGMYSHSGANLQITVLFPKTPFVLNALCKLQDGSFIVVGQTRNGYYRSVVSRFDSQMNLEWASEYTVGPWHSKALEAVEMPDGSFGIIGYRSYSNFSNEVGKYSTYFMRVHHLNGNILDLTSYTDHKREYKLSTNLPARIRAAKTPDGICWATTEEEEGLVVGIHWMHITPDGQEISQKRIYGLKHAFVESLQTLDDGNFLISGATSDADPGATTVGFRSSKYMLMKLDKDGNEIWKSYLGDDLQLQIALGAIEDGQQFGIVGIQEQNASGLNHPCYFKVDRKGGFIYEK